MTRVVRNLLWTLAAAAILLAPAALWGRPFVFYDTPAYWGWGRDIFEALLRPWPGPGQPWIPGRPLHGWEIGAHGATPGDLRFTLTLLTARSAFYALPFYLLSRAGGLWLVAALQALAAAWTVRVAVRALAPAIPNLAFLALVALLALLTSLGFEAAYAMPDLFGGLALLAAGVLIVCPERLGLWSRLGLAAIIAYAALAHTENILNLALAAALAVALQARAGRASLAVGAGPIMAALGVALVLAAGGGLLLNRAFGHPARMAPFVASRVLADGAAQPYLRQACRRSPLAACDLADERPVYAEYYLGVYPLGPPPVTPPRDLPHIYDRIQFQTVSDAQAEHRERFVAEQGRLVLGALETDGLDEIGTGLADGAAAFVNFGVNRDFDSLQGLMREHTQRREQMRALVPGAAACARDDSCAALDVAPLTGLQGGVVWASFALIALGLFFTSAARALTGRLRPFAACMTGLVLANALICGGLSGPYDRYQSRVEWLIPFCALLGLVQWAARRRTADAAAGATFPSPVASIVAATTEARPS
ncbi:MAG TPA: hypothetical protein VHZ26_14510 [Caulobacteraceae bacterium]|jgi:hypothetical protein|nr:hypothetical protein [Caulobacteraceae bacterium]